MCCRHSENTSQNRNKTFKEKFPLSDFVQMGALSILGSRRKGQAGSSLVVQRVEDPALLLQQLGSLLWWGFDPWSGNFHMLQACAPPPPQKRKGQSHVGRGENAFWNQYFSINSRAFRFIGASSMQTANSAG